MMNEIMVDGKQEFMGIDIPNVLGGFGDGKKAISDKAISEIHGVEIKHVRETINKNRARFMNGVDIIDLLDDETIIEPLQMLGYTNMQIAKSKNVYLLSQEGFCKFLQISNPTHDHSHFIKEYFGSNGLQFSLVRYEHCFGELLGEVFRGLFSFVPQYYCCDRYRIDFYCKELNLAVEYDEEHHNSSTKEDVERQSDIENELSCVFIRVKKGKEITGINKIVEHVVKNRIVDCI